MKLVKFCALVLLFTLCIDGGCGEVVTVCKQYNPATDVLPECEGETVIMVKSNQQTGEESLDECAKEKIRKIVRNVINENTKEFTTTATSMTSAARNETPTTGIPATPEPGWINGLNGYQYKVTATTDNWNNIRAACQAMGGDLAVYGLQSSQRLFIAKTSSAADTWIGLTDLMEEGTFRWIDGSLSTADNTAWLNGEPNGGRRENCAEQFGSDVSYAINDSTCSVGKKGLCEKRLENK